jgi:parallel beta-helix repeat protein
MKERFIMDARWNAVQCLRTAIVAGFLLFAPRLAADDLCGATIVADLNLDSDLSCPGDGLFVGADGIKINLNGHTITGSGVGVGITVRARHDVVIQGGTITDFVTGIFISNSSGIVVKENRLTRNREAVFLIASSGNVVKENLAWQNQLRGIMIRPNASGVVSTQNLVSENTLTANPSGILVFAQPGNILKENRIAESTVAGIDLTGGGAAGNLMKENILTGNAAGIRFGPGWTGNRIVENSFQMNTCGVQGTADDNTFKENVFSSNGSDSCF